MDIFVGFIIVLVILVFGELCEKYIESKKCRCEKCECMQNTNDGDKDE